MNLLITGGVADERRRVALAFHHESPQRLGPFVSVCCGREEARLAAGLESWASDSETSSADPLRAAQGGTLFLDEVGCLSSDTQRLLLIFVRHLAGAADDDGPPVRLAAGHEEDLDAAAAEGAFSPPLLDYLDKIHVELGSVRGAA